MNDFVEYLNGLHNYYAQNQNAYGEKNIKSPYYSKTMVPIDVCEFISASIDKNEPHIIILTGHAGDGKTSIMFQVIDKLGGTASFEERVQEVNSKKGETICCIKDFSELPDSERLKILSEIVQYPKQGKFVFMVANTGPLINTFSELFTEEKERDAASMALIDAMDTNDGIIKDITGFKMLIINVASIANTGFAAQYIKKIIEPDLWTSCHTCSKKHYCHILRNRNIIGENLDRVTEFIENFYIWLNEYGTRLTIRSMTEHIAYMLTGGDECDSVNPIEPHRMLFSNLFFGYEGITPNPLADNVLAVRVAKETRIFSRRLRSDEELLIRRNYKNLFGQTITEIIEGVDNKTKIKKEFDDELRRMYLFMSIASEEKHQKDIEDSFSKQFLPYLSVRNGKIKPTKYQKNLVVDALRMIYLGTVISDNDMIPVTMGTEEGITQNVQLIAGKINAGELDLISKDDATLNKGLKNLVLRIKKKEVCKVTLPMVNHFEELGKGVLATDLDPQLSYGIENLKSRLLELADIDDDQFDYLILKNKGFEKKSIVIENGRIIIMQ